MGLTRPRHFRFSEKWIVGIAGPLARPGAVWTQAGVSKPAAISLELLRSLHRHDGSDQRLWLNQPLRPWQLRLALLCQEHAQDRRSSARDSSSAASLIG